MMKLVLIESPYSATTPEGIEANVTYALECVRDSLGRNEAPLCSHLLYTQPGILRDHKPNERAWGIEAGLAWRAVAPLNVFYTDLGWSEGMREAYASAVEQGRPYALRAIRGEVKRP